MRQALYPLLTASYYLCALGALHGMNNESYPSAASWEAPPFFTNDNGAGGGNHHYNSGGHGNGHGNGQANGNGKNGEKSSGAGNAGNIGNNYTGGAGVRQKGETTAYFGYDFFETDHFFNGEGDKKATGSTVYQQVYTGYFEYGLTECDTLMATVAWVSIRQTNTHFPNIRGFRDLNFTWKRKLWEQDNSMFSASFTLTVPSGTSRDQYVSLRAGRFAETILLYFSHEFEIAGRPSGIDFSAGYQFYQGFPSDAVLLATGWRYEFLDRFLFISALSFYDGVGNGRPITLPGGASFLDQEDLIDEEITNPLIRNGRLLTGTLYLVYAPSDNFVISLGTYRNLWGRNVGAQTGYFAGGTFIF